MNVSVLVPFEAGECEWRTRAWEHVRRHYESNHPEWEVVVASCGTSLWSKGSAIDKALASATGDILVLADADSFTDGDTLRAAVEAVIAGAPWVVPHGRVYRLSKRGTQRFYSGLLQPGHTCRMPYMGPAGGGLTVLSRAAYETVGGIDSRFEGWGGEDIAFGWALDTLVGDYQRIGGRLYHLWHPHPAPSHRGSPETEALAARYKEARGNPSAMTALVEEAR